MAMTTNRTSQAFSSFSSMTSSSRRVRTARTPVEAIPLRSPTMLDASRSTAWSLATRREEADDGARRGGDADGRPRVGTHVLVGRVVGDLGAVGHGALDLAELLASDIVLVGELRLDGVHLRGALVLHGLQKLLRLRDDILDVTADGIGLHTAVHGLRSFRVPGVSIGSLGIGCGLLRGPACPLRQIRQRTRARLSARRAALAS